MAEMKSIQIPTELAESAPCRLSQIESALRCIARMLDGETGAAAEAGEAILLVADGVCQLYCDLDVGTWPGAPVARRAKPVAEVAHG